MAVAVITAAKEEVRRSSIYSEKSIEGGLRRSEHMTFT